MKKMLGSIINIIKLKLKNKEELDNWYKERLDICNECPLNSRNIKRRKSIKERILSLISLKKDFCTVCGCTLVDKASGEFEECPKGKWPELNFEEND